MDPAVTATASHHLSALGSCGDQSAWLPVIEYTSVSGVCTPSLQDKRDGWGKKEREEKGWWEKWRIEERQREGDQEETQE